MGSHPGEVKRLHGLNSCIPLLARISCKRLHPFNTKMFYRFNKRLELWTE